ncbi:MAG: cation-translocating P-type ATPase [Myxococcales bacterium]|nr:cation-translocating P-type ATPase [Myxococcales bacterium]
MGLLDRLKAPSSSRRWLRTVVNLFGHRRRRFWSEGGRAHIELRAIPHDDFPRFIETVEATLGAFAGVEWIRVNGLLGRLIVAHNPALTTIEALIAAIEVIEARLGHDQRDFAEVIPDYPSDIEPVARKTVDLTADALGVVLGTALKIAGYRPSRAGFDVAALMTVLDNTPRLRQVLVDNLGYAATEVTIGVTNAFIQAVGAGPIGPMVDLLVQATKLRAELARRRAWKAREPELCASRGHDGHWRPIVLRPRPVELPEGVVERYANEALFASLGGFVVGIADTHNIEAATAPLFGGLPKAALYGRTIFGAELMRLLAERGALCLRTSALRLLDRIDAVVIAGAVLVGTSMSIAKIRTLPGVSREAVVRAAGRLFDGEHPDTLQEAAGWRLGPPDVIAPRGLPEPLTDRTRGVACLALAQGEAVVALVELQPALRPGAESLLASARKTRLHVCVATDDPHLGRATASHQVVGAGDVLEAIRELQRDGRIVLAIADGPPEALAHADVGVGVTLDPEHPPWTADVILGDDLTHAAFIVDACATAREVARQSVVLAGVGAALGAALALGGLKRTKPEQVMLATNAASTIALANGIRQAYALARRPPPPLRDPTPWHRLEVEEVITRLASSAAGLDPTIAHERLRRPPPPPPRALVLTRAIVAELANPLTPILAAGAGLSAVTGSLTDAALISGVFVLNGAIGGVERYQAEREIAALERSERPAVKVCRAGAWEALPAADLVLGDLIELRAGEVVPADCRIFSAADLEVDESSLTGESLPIPKSAEPSYSPVIAERSSMLYEGTAIAAGLARGVVVAIGADTEARRGNLMLGEEAPETGVETRLRRLTEMTLPIAGMAGALLMGAGLMRHQNINQLVDLGVSMTVAAVPEGLPLLATVAQLAAARRLSKRGALVRNPRTVEALGRIDILCADKTGTLTEGRIALHAVADGHRVSRCDAASIEPWARLLVAAGLRASPAAPEGGVLPHPTDRAVVEGGRALAVDPALGFERWDRMHDLPFEPGRGYHGALGRTHRGLMISVKGAPEVLLPRCDRRAVDGHTVPLDAAERAAILASAEALAAEGLRVLAVAERDASEERDLDDARIGRLVFRGFLTLSDPPRATAADAIARLHASGIDVLMITGDHPRTAARIADELGFLAGREVLTGPELEAMADDELDVRLPECAVIARATPAHKVRIVKALQRAGRVVAMTGDGANDASAIRLADVGIALGEESTTAAREAADLIVVDERIETIVDAIAEGRAMWSSVRDAVAILAGGNLGEIGFALVSGLLGGESPLNARQLLLVNLLTDVAPAMAIALRPPSESVRHDLLAEGPEAAMGESLDHEIALRAVTTAAGAGAAYVLANVLPGERGNASTVSLIALVGAQLGQTLLSGAPTPAVLGASLGSMALLLAIVETPGASQLFGCRPVGPIGLATAIGTSALATGASIVAPPAYARLRELLQRRHLARAARQPAIDVDVIIPGTSPAEAAEAAPEAATSPVAPE